MAYARVYEGIVKPDVLVRKPVAVFIRTDVLCEPPAEIFKDTDVLDGIVRGPYVAERTEELLYIAQEHFPGYGPLVGDRRTVYQCHRRSDGPIPGHRVFIIHARRKAPHGIKHRWIAERVMERAISAHGVAGNDAPRARVKRSEVGIDPRGEVLDVECLPHRLMASS